MTFGMTTFLIWTALRLATQGLAYEGRTGKLLEHWLCHSSSLYKFGIVNDRIFSIAVGLINEGLFFDDFGSRVEKCFDLTVARSRGHVPKHGASQPLPLLCITDYV